MSLPRLYPPDTVSYDLSARAAFRGDSTKLVLQPGSSWPTDELGVTTLTRRFWCRRDLAARALPRRGDVDRIMRDLQLGELRVVDFDATDSGTSTMFTVRYNGFLAGSRRDTIIQRGPVNEELEVELHPRYPLEGSMTLVYLAPTWLKAYATDREPLLKDRYKVAGYVAPVRPLYFRSNGLTIEADKDDLRAFLRWFDFELRTERVQFDPQPDGHVWRVSEKLQRRIVQPRTIDATTFLAR